MSPTPTTRAATDADEAPWPPATTALAAAILLILAVEQSLGVHEHPASVGLRCGAVDGPSVFFAQEWWRLLPAAFVHFPLGGRSSSAFDTFLDLPHALLNGWALIQLGSFFEDVWGSARFLVVFFLSALGCSLASAWFGAAVSAGASGGLFGLIGFLVVARWAHGRSVRALVDETFGRQLLFWAVAVLVLGASSSVQSFLPIDQAGHLGGLGVGVALGLLFRKTEAPGAGVRVLAGALVVAALVSFGFVVAQGERAARVESALEDAAIAAAELDQPTAAKALDRGLDADAGAILRFTGRNPRRALILVEAAIAAVRSDDAVHFAQVTAPVLGEPWGDAVLATAHLATHDPKADAELKRLETTLPPIERLGLALFFERAGWSRPALRLLESALASEPTDPTALNAVAWVLLTAKDESCRQPKRGLELARAAVAAQPDTAESLDTLAEGERQAGLDAAAQAHEKRAIELARERRDEKLVSDLRPRLEKIESHMK